MGSNGMMGYGLMGLLMMASLLLVVVGVILLLVWIVRKLGSPQDSSATGVITTINQEPPLSILQRRYASGEIGREEYERVRADLLRDIQG